MSKKILFILMPEDYRDEEFYIPFNLLDEKKYIIDVASFAEGYAVGANGYKHPITYLLDNLTNEDFDKYDALVIPGGPGSTRYLWNNAKVQEAIQYFNINKKIVAAICHACAAPAQAGILRNKQATIYPTNDAKAIFAQNAVTFNPSGCVTLKDDKIITAQGPKFAEEFGLAIIDLLESE